MLSSFTCAYKQPCLMSTANVTRVLQFAYKDFQCHLLRNQLIISLICELLRNDHCWRIPQRKRFTPDNLQQELEHLITATYCFQWKKGENIAEVQNIEALTCKESERNVFSLIASIHISISALRTQQWH